MPSFLKHQTYYLFMDPLFTWILIFIVSLAVLIKSSDYFTDAAEEIGLYLRIPAFIVGVTIVSIGTSAPELVSSVFAVLRGSSEIVSGNVVGSNITNIFLILGVCAILSKRLEIEYELINVDLPLFVSSAFLLAATAYDGLFTFGEALLCIAGFVLYILYTVAAGREKGFVSKHDKKKLALRVPVVFVLSAVFIFFSAQYTVESVIRLSELLNIGVEIIALGAVSLGTSLPELMVGISAASRGKSEIAVGNVLGSNIFNCFAVMGFPALFGVIVVPESITMFALPLMLAATLLYLFITQDKQITQWEGWMLIIFYIFFLGKVFSFI